VGEWREWERGWEVQVEAYHMAHEIELERGSGGATRGRARQAALTCSSCSFTVPGESGGVFVKPGLPFPHTFTMEIFREEPSPAYFIYCISVTRLIKSLAKTTLLKVLVRGEWGDSAECSQAGIGPVSVSQGRRPPGPV
jgi:hypothetical protein